MPNQCKNPHCPLWVKRGSEWCDKHEPKEVTLEHLEEWLKGLESEYDRNLAKMDARDQIMVAEEHQRMEREEPDTLEQIKAKAAFQQSQAPIKADIRGANMHEILKNSPTMEIWVRPDVSRWQLNGVWWPLKPGIRQEVPLPIAADYLNCQRTDETYKRMIREMSAEAERGGKGDQLPHYDDLSDVLQRYTSAPMKRWGDRGKER